METHDRDAEAQPLERRGSYRIELKEGTRPAPATPVSGDALASFYAVIVRSRLSLVYEQDRARSSGDYEQKYRLKIAISSTEAVAALLHGVIAPSASYVCGHGCRHMLGGLDPARCKVFLDALDAAVDGLIAENAHTPPSHVTYLDGLRMIQVYGGWRDRFVALCS